MFEHLEPIYAVGLAYVALFLGVCTTLAVIRVALVLRGKRAPSSFSPDAKDESPFLKRVTRAHANIYENLGVFAVILLLAGVTDQIELLNGLAYVFLIARVIQTSVHLISISDNAITVRGVAFFTQKGIEIYWVGLLLFGATGTPGS